MRRVPILIALVFLPGCSSLGPSTVPRDRFDYASAVSESWQRQLLLNMVKIRYGDTPMFVDVGQIVSGYTWQSTYSISGNLFNTQGFNPGTTIGSLGLGTQGQFTDRPTITYTPLVGEQFARQILAPIPPATIMGFVQAGHRVGLVLRLLVQEINGIHNRLGDELQQQPADPRFYELLAALRRIQLSGDLTLRVQPSGKDKSEVTLVTFRKRGGPDGDADTATVRRLLGLDPSESEFHVVYGSLASNNKEIAILSRSMLQILINLSSTIEVPEQHVAEHRVSANVPPEIGPEGTFVPLLRVSSGSEQPRDAFVAVPYRGQWFWIDDRDLESKRFFSFLLFAFSLVESAAKGGAPVLTIPAQ